MTWPNRVQEIVQTLYSQHIDLANGDDDQRRQLTLWIAEQVRFELGAQWGTKRADGGRPLSKDSISLQAVSGFYNFDWQNGSTRQPNNFPEGVLIGDQVFVPVAAINHLNVGTTLPEPPVVVPPTLPLTTVDMSAVLQAIGALGKQVDSLAVKVEGLALKLNSAAQDITDIKPLIVELKVRPPITYKGSIFGASITLFPQPPKE